MIGKDDKMGFIFCYLDVNNLSGMEFLIYIWILVLTPFT